MWTHRGRHHRHHRHHPAAVGAEVALDPAAVGAVRAAAVGAQEMPAQNVILVNARSATGQVIVKP